MCHLHIKRLTGSLGWQYKKVSLYMETSNTCLRICKGNRLGCLFVEMLFNDRSAIIFQLFAMEASSFISNAQTVFYGLQCIRVHKC